MSNRNRALTGAVLALSLFATPGCHRVPLPEAEPIRILAAFNLSGSDSELDVAAFNGAKLAGQRINEAGGVLGREVELVPVDTASAPTSAVNLVERAFETQANIVAGIGYCDSTFADEIGQVFQKAGVPFVSPGATDPTLPGRVGDMFFLAAYGDDAQARAMAEFASDQLHKQRIAVWVDESRDYPVAVSTYFEESFETLGGDSTHYAFTPTGNDFSQFINELAKARPPFDAIYGATMPATAVPFIRQIRAAGIDVPLLSGDGWDEEPVVQASRETGLSGIYFSTHRYLGVQSSALAAFVAAYAKIHGHLPTNAFAALGHDSVDLLANAIQRARSTEPDAIRAALAKTTNFAGLVGPITYRDGSRVPTKAVSIIHVDRGKETAVWSTVP